MPNTKRDFKVLLPIDDPELAPELIPIAAALAGQASKLIILNVLEVPSDHSLTEATTTAQKRRQDLQELAHNHDLGDIQIRTMVRVSYLVWREIVSTVVREDCDLLLLPWKGYSSKPGQVFGTTIDAIFSHPPCDLAVIKPVEMANCEKILLPARGGSYAELAMGIAERLAEKCDGTVTVMHVIDETIPESERAIEDKPYSEFMGHIRNKGRVHQVTRESHSVQEALIEEARNYHLVVMGATASQIPSETPLGSIAQRVVQEAERSVIVVRTREPFEPFIATEWWAQQMLEAAGTKTDDDLSPIVDKWFAENTFHHSEFADIGELVRLKHAQGQTISLGLPALNEESTVGEIIHVVKKALMEDQQLLDEIVLIDSKSTDRTVEIAEKEGIPVAVHQDILSEHGSYRGKGEALWKSLHMLKGDIIVWIDTDIRNIRPEFVSGLVGALLHEPHIQFVKGYYRRPIKLGDELFETGGGRVTELTIRPLFNLFYPELSGLIQPLAGEYAGRREALEKMPFFTGYGVETGLLIDLLETYGLEAIGQVNLEERIHRNQSLAALSVMAFAIVQVVMQRLQEKERIEFKESLNRSMKLIKFEKDHLSLAIREIQDHERPPIVTIPEYIEKQLSRRTISME